MLWFGEVVVLLVVFVFVCDEFDYGYDFNFFDDNFGYLVNLLYGFGL